VRSWGLSVQEQEELWRRWRQGESLRLIGRRMGKRGPSIRAFVLQTGGVQQRPPQRAARSLTAVEREEISRGVAAGDSSRAIASRLVGLCQVGARARRRRSHRGAGRLHTGQAPAQQASRTCSSPSSCHNVRPTPPVLGVAVAPG
jgi:hypothetical protein